MSSKRKSFTVVDEPAPAATGTMPVQATAVTAARAEAGRASVAGLDSVLDGVVRQLHSGGLPGAPLSMPVFTKEAAAQANRPLRLHRTADLVLHPNNPRPTSGASNLDDLRVDMRKNGQKDPIHIVPFQGGWAIMEGQRRWLAAKAEGIETLEAFEHPEMSPLEVFLYGYSSHGTREQPCAIDDAMAFKALLDTGMTRGQLIEMVNATVGEKKKSRLSEGSLAKILSITEQHEDLLHEIRAKPEAFTERHLYALSQFVKVVGMNRAIDEARAIRFAPDDQPVSAKSLERMLDRIKATQDRQRVRKASLPKTILDGNGAEVGMCRGYADGRVEFKPGKPLPKDLGEELHARLSRMIHDFYVTEVARIEAAGRG